MNSRIVLGQLSHVRRTPKPHHFRYRVVAYVLDLDELATLDRTLPWFGYNRARPISIHDRDYLDGGDRPLRERFLERLAAHGLAGGVERVQLVTAPRFLGHAFNPVSFWYALGADGDLRCAVAEVNNTFGERHLYLLDDLVRSADGWETRGPVSKAFHVSPFFDRAGAYHFRLSAPGRPLDVAIRYERDGHPAFDARWWGETLPLDGRGFARALWRHPVAPLLTWPRILAQAARLRFGRGLAWHPKPEPSHALTIRRPGAGPVERAAAGLVRRAFERTHLGRLELALPDGTVAAFGPPSAAPPARLDVHHGRLFGRIVRHGDIGLGEAYEDGDWSSPDLPGLLALLARNRAAYQSAFGPLARLARAPRRVPNDTHANRGRRSHQNVRAHYDLGNEFFARFLDPSMTYSAAMFGEPGEALERAQERKLDAVAARARLAPGRHVLEIGCGWGSFALRAAGRCGCRVTGVTLSPRQLALARERVQAAGLAERVDLRLQDYREIRGTYDAIVSIEMLEAVGHEYYGTFFRTLDRLLARGGRAVVQTITIADQRYEDYRRHGDWIQKHVFPGGLVPSVSALTAAMTRESSLVLEELHTFGHDYARTLAAWRERMLAERTAILALGLPDSFVRRWEYYLAYCEAGFRLGELNVAHLVLARPETASAPA